jgi:hypothetical protein
MFTSKIIFILGMMALDHLFNSRLFSAPFLALKAIVAKILYTSKKIVEI